MKKPKAVAIWNGSGKEGTGNLSTGNQALNNTPYSFKSRFEGGVGTNPEELIAAAHAGCFTMKLAFSLDAAGFTPTKLETSCEITFADGTITASELSVEGTIPNISKEKFDEVVEDAKTNCPISKLLNAKITAQAILNKA